MPDYKRTERAPRFAKEKKRRSARRENWRIGCPTLTILLFTYLPIQTTLWG